LLFSKAAILDPRELATVRLKGALSALAGQAAKSRLTAADLGRHLAHWRSRDMSKGGAADLRAFSLADLGARVMC
jgi:hypothetical protein